MEKRIYLIGHGNMQLKEFLGILKEEWNQIKSKFTKIIERLEK